MVDLYFDIETMPAGDEMLPEIEAAIRDEGPKIDGRVKKQETIDEKTREWEASIPQLVEERRSSSSLSASDGGRILCIGYQIGYVSPAAANRLDSEGIEISAVIGWDDYAQKMHLDERRVLQEWGRLCSVLTSACGDITYVGYNILGFDLPFIWQRSVILDVLPHHFPSLAKYRKSPVYDLMQIWSNWGRAVKLDALCRLLGIRSPKEGGMDGSQVWPALQEGRDKEIRDYCLADTAVLAELHHRMEFWSSGTSTLP